MASLSIILHMQLLTDGYNFVKKLSIKIDNCGKRNFIQASNYHTIAHLKVEHIGFHTK